VIEQIMCRGSVDCAAVGRRHGAGEDWAADSLASLEPLIADGIVRVDGDQLELADWARPLARVVAAAFDSYLPTGPGRHAVSV
jgi:oxygen-independent coproporphyrinogen-3 oxidase